MTPAVRYYARLMIFTLIVFTLLRFAFFLYFKKNLASAETLAQAFFLGLRYDLRVFLVLALPNMILGLIPPFNLRWSSFARSFWCVYWIFVLTLAISFHVFNFGYYSYLGAHTNATALRFLVDLSISSLMLWQTYPVIRICIALVLVGYGIKLIYQLGIITAIKDSVENVSFKRSFLGGLAFTLFVLVGLWGKVSQYPLRWSDAYFSNDSFVSAVAVNPVHYFFDTFKYRKTEFNKDAAAKYFSYVSSYLGLQGNEPLDFTRTITPTQRPDSPINVIIIVLESMAAYKTGTFGNPLDPTPHLDSIIKKSVLFKNHFVPTEATARSIFSLLTGTPDVNTDHTSSRNPMIASQNLIINSFQDYSKFYFIGGSASWGNIRGLLSYNIPELKIIEEGKFKSEKTDVWGISDLAMFQEANELFKQQKGKPFFSVIQTAGFHRPYTIPNEKMNFQTKNPSPEEIKKAGFISAEEYNSLRFQDFSLGKFFEIASKEDYFKNSLIVILGDHGLPDNEASHLKRGQVFHGLTRWHVPLVFHSEKLFPQAHLLEDIASELDIMTTVASLAGIEHKNTTLGRNLFDNAHSRSQYAFIYTYYNHPPGVGIVDKQYYMKCDARQCHGLYDYLSENPEKDLSPELPEKAQEMRNLVYGIYESAKYLLYHNPNPLVK